MKEFTRGILFAVSMAMFGKGMYGLGKLDERKRNRKNWIIAEIKLEELKDILDEVMNEEEA